jgi:toxin-antitoxin system PIN domain toxin
VYGHRQDSPFHKIVAPQLKKLAEGQAQWAIPWPCLHEFLAIVTHARIYNPPTPIERALDQVDAWMESPSLTLLSESELHWNELRSLITTSQVTGPRIHDARVAALCRQHGARVLWSADRDFGRFPELNVVNPAFGV